MRTKSKILTRLVVCAVVALPASLAISGGAGDGDGVEILPGCVNSWLGDHPEVDPCEIVARIGADDGGFGGLTVDITGPGIDLHVTFAPEEDLGDGVFLNPVLVTGTIDGNPILTPGYAVPTGDGKIKIYDPDLGGGRLRMCSKDDDIGGFCYGGHLILCPAAFGDGNPRNNICGNITSNNGGLIKNPEGKRIVRH